MGDKVRGSPSLPELPSPQLSQTSQNSQTSQTSHHPSSPIMIYLNDDITSLDLAAALQQLPQWRREQALRYRHEIDRKLNAAAYMLLWQGLKAGYGLEAPPELALLPGGKPYLKGHPDIHFNLSHCPKAALCAIAGVPVGADIESIRPYNPQLARRVLSEAEVEQVESSPSPDIVFARLWTMKESLLKLTGEGIRRDLKSVLVNISARFATTINTARGYVFTVCTEQ